MNVVDDAKGINTIAYVTITTISNIPRYGYKVKVISRYLRVFNLLRKQVFTLYATVTVIKPTCPFITPTRVRLLANTRYAVFRLSDII